MNRTQRKICRAGCASILFTLLLSGCGGGSGGGTGTLNVGVTDAPIDGAYEVVVTFSGVELKPVNGSPFSLNLDIQKRINLLNLQGGDFEFLAENASVPAGEYEWARLKVITNKETTDSYITFTATGPDAKYPLYVPGSNNDKSAALKFIDGFTVPEEGEVNLTVDFDLKKSIVEPKNPDNTYFLKPVLHVVQNADAGHIVGTVPASTYSNDPTCVGAVYLYAGNGVEPFDYYGDSQVPVTSAPVKHVFNDTTQEYEYRYGFGFINAGDYTVSFTCDANLDNVEQNDMTNMNFIGTANVTVTAGQTTQYNFPDPLN